MIRIALCDDDPMALKQLQALLQSHVADMELTAYMSPLEMMAAFERGHRWDIVLLDIMMPGENGMELAREIRQADGEVKIIFLTSSPEFAVQSYTVGATYYLLKPIAAQSLFSVLDRAVAACQKAQAEKLVLKCKSGIAAVAPSDVVYCEVFGRSLCWHMRDGQVLESRGKLDELENQLSALGGFWRLHRCYLINLRHVQNLTYRVATLADGTSLPIPHGKYNDVKKAYLAYAFEKERVLL